MKNLSQLTGLGKKFGTGIILSGGGARGFAHAGILKALNECGIYPDVISGVSAGAIVGAFYADGYTPDEIFKLFSQDNRFFDYVQLTVPKSGLFRTRGLRENLGNNLRAKKFSDLQTPLYIAATDLNNGKIVYFDSGMILDTVLASAAIPVLFEPVEIDGTLYVDGGVIDNFPVEPIRKHCRKIIGISLNPIHEEKDFNNLLRIAERTFRLSASANITDKTKACNILLEPPELAEYGILDVSRGNEMFELGYQSALSHIRSLR